MNATQLAFWMLLVSIATPVIYLGQLIVLILIYFRVIKETDRNAQERQAAIDRAGETMQAQGKVIEQGLNTIAKRNMIGFGIMGACVVALWLRLGTKIREFERITKHER